MKKGFTLTELLAVVAIIAVLALLLVPNFLRLFSDNKNRLSDIQKQEIESAVEMYVNDYCINPISDSYDCPTNWNLSTNNKGLLEISNATISLEELSDKNYLDSRVIAENCSGNITIVNGNIDLSNITCNFNR